MARNTLSLLFHPNFQQVLDSIVEQESERVDRLLAKYQLAPQLPLCCYESPESSLGACDGGQPCTKRATVHDPKTGLDYCLEHFEGVICG